MATFILKFDPIEYARKLRGAGMTQDQADIQAQELERIVELQSQALLEQREQQAKATQEYAQKLSNLEAKELANKGDLREVELRLLKEIEVVRREIATLKYGTLKFIIWTGVGVSAILISTLGSMMAKGFSWW